MPALADPSVFCSVKIDNLTPYPASPNDTLRKKLFVTYIVLRPAQDERRIGTYVRGDDIYTIISMRFTIDQSIEFWHQDLSRICL